MLHLVDSGCCTARDDERPAETGVARPAAARRSSRAPRSSRTSESISSSSGGSCMRSCDRVGRTNCRGPRNRATSFILSYLLFFFLSFPGAAVCARGGRNECSEYRTHRSKLEAQWSGCGHSACWPSRVAPLGGRPPTFRCLIAFWAQIARRFRFSDYFSENKDETRKCQAISTSSPLGQFS